MLTQANGQMARDQAQLKNAQVDLERYRTLLAQDSISKQQVDTQEALVRQFQGTVASDQGAIDNARLQLTYRAYHRADQRPGRPAAGGPRQHGPRIGLQRTGHHRAGQADDGASTRCRKTTCRASSSARRAARKSPSTRYDRGGKIKLATGRLLTFDNQIDTTTGTVKLKAEFPNQDGAALSESVRQRAHGASKPGRTPRWFLRRPSSAALPGPLSFSSGRIKRCR